MDILHFHWGLILFWIIKLLKVFGIIPGAIAARWVQKLYQKRRQTRAIVFRGRLCFCRSRSQLSNTTGCPIQATSLFLSLGWDTTNLNPPVLLFPRLSIQRPYGAVLLKSRTR
jgi:hypothetical protein